jgi:hypothetical protein
MTPGVQQVGKIVRSNLAVVGALVLAVFFGFDPAWSQNPGKDGPFVPSPKVDARGFIDVWQLRGDVAEVEARETNDNADQCYIEGDPDEKRAPSPREVKRRALAEQACVEKVRRDFAAYRKIFASFNAAWLPVMREAIRKGDGVAEVILLQCDTTSAFDRSGIDSSCHPEPAVKAKANERLAKIGFTPAYEPSFSYDDSRRAFTLRRDGPGTGWNTESFGTLRLNRKPLTPGRLTWGSEAHAGGYSHPPDKRRPRGNIEEGEAYIDKYLKQDPRWSVFLLHRLGHHEWVPEGMKSTTHALNSEWVGIWQMERGTKDWASPMEPRKGRAIIKQNGEFTQITIDAERETEPLLNVTDCTLRYSGGLTYRPEQSDVASVSTILGYFLPTGAHRLRGSRADTDRVFREIRARTETLRDRDAITKVLASLDLAVNEILTGTFWGNRTNKEAVAPFDPKKNYRQVLMQCRNAESDESSRLRFLLLAGDTLVEFGAEAPYIPWRKEDPTVTLHVRHYRRTQ